MYLDPKYEIYLFFRNVDYWEAQRIQFQTDCAYYNVKNKLPGIPVKNWQSKALKEPGHSVAIDWHSLEWKDSTCYFKVYYDKYDYILIGIQDANRYKTYSFLSAKQYQYLVEMDKVDKIKQDIFFKNTHPILATVSKQITVIRQDKSDSVSLSVGDTIAIMKATPEVSSFIRFGQFFVINNSYVQYNNPSDLQFLVDQGTSGEKLRYAAANKYDSLYSQRILAGIEQKMQEIAVLQQELNEWANRDKKQYFILATKYSFSTYHFGMKFRFYNCFKKAIKYIYTTIRAYNQVNDLQRDDIGRNEAQTRCIGPIAYGTYGDFDFDELFWDNNNLIDHLSIYKVRVVFMDGTEKLFTGQATVKTHIDPTYYDREF